MKKILLLAGFYLVLAFSQTAWDQTYSGYGYESQESNRLLQQQQNDQAKQVEKQQVENEKDRNQKQLNQGVEIRDREDQKKRENYFGNDKNN